LVQPEEIKAYRRDKVDSYFTKIVLTGKVRVINELKALYTSLHEIRRRNTIARAKESTRKRKDTTKFNASQAKKKKSKQL